MPIFLLVIFSPASGQEPYFRKITDENDFDRGQFNTIFQDKKGFIWIGTQRGIFRFDGSDFTELDLPVELSTKSSTLIFEDSKDNLWFGFENGNLISYDGFKFYEPEWDSAGPANKITSMVEGTDQSIWAGTYGAGIFIIRNDEIIHLNLDSGLSDDFIYCLMLDKQGNVWSGTDNGINISGISNGQIGTKHLSVEAGLPDFIVKSLKLDDSGNIWIGMFDKGFCRYNPDSGEFYLPNQENSWTYGSVEAILPMDENVWVATDGAGLIEYHTNDSTLQALKTTFENGSYRIKKMIQDDEGNVWLMSASNIYLSFGNKIRFLSTLDGYPISNIHAMVCDDDNNLWFANDIGIHKFAINKPANGDQLRLFLPEIDINLHKIMSLYLDPYGMIWAGTFGRGLLRLDPQIDDQTMISEENGLINSNVLSINSTQYDIWFATLGGVSKCALDSRLKNIQFTPEFTNYSRDEGLINSYIYHLQTDSLNRIWLATDGNGVCYFDKGKFMPLTDDSAFNQKVIYSIALDNSGNVWMNSAKEGLFRFDGNTIQKIIADDEHKNLSFSGILADDNHELVIVYNEGIDVLNTETLDIIHYEGNAGLTNLEPDLNAITTDHQGNIWIGTAKGIVKYSPSNHLQWKRPQPRLIDVLVFFEKIDHRQIQEFSYHQNHLVFNYTGLWYQYPEQLEYLIMLEGHDLDWIRTKNKNVIYSNLKPGKYTFHAKTGLYENFKNSDTASYSFEIKQPFWWLWWFWIIIIILIGLLIFTFIKGREKRLKKKEEILRERIIFQFENLKSQINPHFLFNSFSTLIALIDQNKDVAIEYVEELSNLFRTVLEYKDKDVISLSEELLIVRNYFKVQQKRYNENLILNIEEVNNSDQLKIPPLTLQLLLENAIKHNVVSKDKPLSVHVYFDEKIKYLYVENNLQAKKEVVKSTGIGIRNIIERYHLLTEKEVKVIKTDKIFKVGLPVLM
ncbi:MAG: histidine kinase [Bacteroidales bacterium]|nr:histidine kinase [Bacteroidales bacterium]